MSADEPPRPAGAGAACEVNVSIINYRTAEMTIRCVESLLATLEDVDARITLVDNASGDGSAERLTEWIASLPPAGVPVSLIASPVNIGFAGGHNLGMAAEPGARFHLILNSDALVRPGAVRTLLAAADADPGAGLIAPRLEHEDGAQQISAFRLQTPVSEFVRGAASAPVQWLLERWWVPLPLPHEVQAIGWVSFACVLLRAEAAVAVGPMDDGYFLYFEDADHCARIARAGWGIRFEPRARIVHLRGGSAPVKALAARRARLPAYYYASRTRLLYKLHGRAGLIAANLAWHLGRGVAALRRLAGRPIPPAPEREWRDIWTNVLTPLGDPRRPEG